MHIDFAGAGDIAGETERGGNDGARVKRKCEVAGLLDLLHDGEHRRSDGTAGGVAGEAAPGSGKDFLRGGVRGGADVHRSAAVLPGAETRGRYAGAERGRDAAEFCDGDEQSEVHDLSADFYGLLDRVLAA